MEGILIQIIQFALSLSILVLFHEAGHCIVAKLCGIRVDKFYLFFNPWFHIFEYKPKNSETTYGLGWLPFGGYCQIAGMIDETQHDVEKLAKPAEPWEFRAHPAWQRLLVMVAGVVVNFIMALMIYSAIMFTWGRDYIKITDYTYGMKFNEEAKAYGFQDHDILVGTDKGEFGTMDLTDVFRTVADAKRVDVLRDGEAVSVELPGNLDLLQMLKSQPRFMFPYTKAEVDSIYGPNAKPAAKITHEEYGLLESIPAGIKYGWNVLSGYVGDMRYVFSKEGAKSLGGFGTLGSLFDTTWNWHVFWLMTAFFSIILAFMNILPIPALDGGHVLFLIVEAITGRKPSDNFMVYAEYVGMGILVALLLLANGNDILRALGWM